MSNINKLSFVTLLFFTIVLAIPASQSFAAPFTSGNVVVCRVGDGSAALTSAATAIFLDEYTLAGGLVQSIALPTTVSGLNRAITGSGTSTSECGLTRSLDGRFLIVTGFDAAPGTASISSSVSTTINRVVGRVDASGNVDTSTTTTSFSANSIRSAVSDNGTNIWMAGGNNGIIYNTLGGSGLGTAVSTTITNNRFLTIFQNQLYVTHGSGATVGRFCAVGTGLPTMAGSTHNPLPGSPINSTSPYGMVFFDLDAGVAGYDTLYVADDSSDVAAPPGGIKKYSLVGGNWTLNGTAPGNGGTVLASLFRGMVGQITAAGVELYVTRNSNQIVKYVDNSGYNSFTGLTGETSFLPGVPTLLVTAATNTSIRGIAWAPTAPVAAGVTVGGRVTDVAGRGLGRVVVTLSGGELTQPLRTLTSPLGYYLFDDLTVGSTYVMTVGSKQYTFSPNTRVISLTDAITDVDFTADAPQSLIGPSIIKKR